MSKMNFLSFATKDSSSATESSSNDGEVASGIHELLKVEDMVDMGILAKFKKEDKEEILGASCWNDLKACFIFDSTRFLSSLMEFACST